MKRIISLILIISSFSPHVVSQRLVKDSPENQGMSTDRLTRLSSTLGKYTEEGKLPGVVALIARGGKIVYHEAFGYSDLEKEIPMKKDNIFRIASQSKAIVSVGIMMLQEEGQLLITDPLSQYIPEFLESTVAEIKEGTEYEIVQAKREITLRDLLTHTAGIGYGYGPASDKWKAAGIQGWYFAHKEEPILETVKKMGQLPNEAHPGEAYVYGYNTDILGAVIEVVSGKSLEEFLIEKILKPLGMNDTHFYLPPSKSPRLSVVYNQEKGKLKRAPVDGTMTSQGEYVSGARTSFSAGAGLLSTSMDYAIFLQMLLNGGEYNGSRIISRKSVELMISNHLGDVKFPWSEGTGFGLGFAITTDLGERGLLGTKGEFGWGGAYHSVYWADPIEDLLVVYFTQVIPISLDDHEKLRPLVYQSLIDE